MTPSMGFSVVLTASVLVMMASITGLPASTTHCQVKYLNLERLAALNLNMEVPNRILSESLTSLHTLFTGDGYSWSKYSKRVD